MGHKIWGPISHLADAQGISADKVGILDKLSHQPQRTCCGDDVNQWPSCVVELAAVVHARILLWCSVLEIRCLPLNWGVQ